jgi:hypothetical protein
VAILGVVLPIIGFIPKITILCSISVAVVVTGPVRVPLRATGHATLLRLRVR